MLRSMALLLVVGLVCGCGAEPPRSGGRTAAYWAEVLKQNKVELRRKAATKLGPLILTDAAALPAVLDAIHDSDADVRARAFWALGVYCGPKAAEIVPVLREVCERELDPKAKEAATAALRKLNAGG